MSRDAVVDRDDVFIDGEFIRAQSANRLELVSPVSEERIASVAAGDAHDVDLAVRAARSALGPWRSSSPADRAGVLRALADAYTERKDQIGALVAAENASPRWWTVQENEEKAPSIYRFFADAAEELAVEAVHRSNGGESLVRREPVGVAGVIVPWNSPQVQLASKIGAALAAGCTVVAKPSAETTLDGLVLGELFKEIDLPAGVVNIVTGGAGTGEALVRHAGVDKLAFTGSTAVGREIAAICGNALKPLTAELGGKSAAVLLDDADLDAFCAGMLRTCVPFSGQVCFSCTRILAPRRSFDEVLDAVVARMRSFVFGDPSDAATELGPLVSARQLERVEGYVQCGIDEGARLVTGGKRPAQLRPGYYVPPTVFTGVEPGMRIFREEIFGPVIVVVPYRDERDAVKLHNATDYGLHGMVFSADVERATALARELETGGISINGARGAGDVTRAAYKGSGIGMGGAQVLDEYLLAKQIALPL
jgi:aldehyde dehydrogenase (NAD+)